jgi:hypothetical protein
MSTNLDEHFDGDLPLESLTPAERAAADSIRAATVAVRTALPDAAPDFAPRVMQRIIELGLAPQPRPGAAPAAWVAAGGRLRAVAAAIWRPRRIVFDFRPAYGFGLALSAVLMLAYGGVPERQAAGFASVAADAGPVYVQFRLNAGDVRSVSLAGSFSEWHPHYQMVETGPGVWTLVVGLPPGVHDYAFLVDGEHWVADPAAPTVDDGFGGVNSRLALLPAAVEVF